MFKTGEYENALNNHYLEGLEYVMENSNDKELE